MERPPRLFTIPASAPFLPTLLNALAAGELIPGFAFADPLALANATIYLPTRRACRLARDAFLDALKTEAATLPRIVALGDIDEDEIVFAQASTGALARRRSRAPARVGRFRAARAVSQADPGLEPPAPERRRGRPAPDREQPGHRVRARRRFGAPDGRHDDPAGAVEPPRPTGPGRDGCLLAAHVAISENRPRQLAQSARRQKRHRSAGTPRPADRRRGRTASGFAGPAGDRGRIDRLDARDRGLAGNHCASAARSRRAARTRHTSRR